MNGTGLVSVNKDIRLARNLGPGSGSLVTNSIGNLNINGGTVRVFGNVVDGGGNSIVTVHQIWKPVSASPPETPLRAILPARVEYWSGSGH